MWQKVTTTWKLAASSPVSSCPCKPRSMNCMVSTTKNVKAEAHSTKSPEMLTECMYDAWMGPSSALGSSTAVWLVEGSVAVSMYGV